MEGPFQLLFIFAEEIIIGGSYSSFFPHGIAFKYLNDKTLVGLMVKTNASKCENFNNLNFLQIIPIRLN
jgi:hypothetical protein